MAQRVIHLTAGPAGYRRGCRCDECRTGIASYKRGLRDRQKSLVCCPSCGEFVMLRSFHDRTGWCPMCTEVFADRLSA